MFDFGGSSKKYCKEIVPGLFYFAEFAMLDCSMYVWKAQNGEFMLVDAGNGKSLDGFIGTLENQKISIKKIKKILITHEHIDHVLGLYPLMEMIAGAGIDPPEIVALAKTAEILHAGDEDQICPGSLGISVGMFGVEIKPLKVTAVNEGDEVKFDTHSFKVYETPGHSLGSATFYEPAAKVLFPGDVVFPQGSFGRYDFPGGSLKKLQQSVERLSKFDVLHLCAGHMDPVIGNAKKHIESSLKNIMYM